MNILITGGAGYIGHYTANLLNKSGHKVIVIDNLSTGDKDNLDKGIQFYDGDITNASDLIRVFGYNDINLVIHFAGKIIVEESINKPIEYYYTNVEGTRLLLKYMEHFSVNKIIFSSSASVYGNYEGIANEETITDPMTPYASTKLTCEDMIKYSGIEYIIFRYFNVAGGKQKGNSLIANIKNSDIITIYGDGSNIRDFIHVKDIAEAHFRAVKHMSSNNTHELINLGCGRGYTVLETIMKSNKDYIFTKARAGDIKISLCDNKKAEIIGWKPIRSIEEMLKEDTK